MRVLVIGGTGFIGRHLVGELLRRGHGVTLFHRHPAKRPAERVTELLGDRKDVASVRTLTGGRFDAAIDLAYDWERRTTGEDVARLVDVLRPGLSRYVFLSSAAVYEAGLRIREDHPRSDALGGLYAADKIASEDFLFGEHRVGRLSVSIVRPPFVYGPHNNIPRETWFWDRILAGRPVIVPDEGKTLMHMVAAKDVAWALAESADHPAADGEAFNIAEPDPVTHAEWVDRLAAIAGTQIEKVFVPRVRIRELGGNPIGNPMYFGHTLDAEVDFSLDISKARDRLHFRPADSREGLQETFAWYLREDRPSRKPPAFSFDRTVVGS